MEFAKLTLDSLTILKEYFKNNNCRICDCTTGGTFMWRDYHKTEYTVDDGVLYLRVHYPGLGSAFAPPRAIETGAEVDKKSYEHILAYCEQECIPARICAVSEAVRDYILAVFPGSASHTDRAWSDYLYLSESIKNLPGRKFAGQRNHINRFLRENLDWSFEPITGVNIAIARDFFADYSQKNEKDYPAYAEGNLKTLEVLDNLELYGQFGGILFAGGSVAGASLGEIVGDTLFVHVEKADTAYHGSYPMLVNQFAKKFAPEPVKYINREEDDGVEGLRTSKLSYHPETLLDKYIVELKR